MPLSNLSHSRDFTGENFYIGLDVHKKSWSVTVRTSNLEVGHFSQAPDPKALHSYLTKKFPSGTYYSAYEAGFSGTSSHTALCKLGIQNIIVHAGDIPNTDKEKKSKTDVHDSRTIAKYLEKGLLKPIHVLTDQQQELRGYFRLRESQVRDQTKANHRLKSYLDFIGIHLPKDMVVVGKFTNKQLLWIENQQLSTSAGQASLERYITNYREQRARVTEVTKSLRTFIIEKFPDAYNNLLTIPGIGSTTAIALIAEIGDFNRFETPCEYCSYLGMIPWDH
ncbi:IS110 family RNA-guided transposase, partial [Arachidicoccus ginsenosidivorans]